MLEKMCVNTEIDQIECKNSKGIEMQSKNGS